jgi:hypothetical protein
VVQTSAQRRRVFARSSGQAAITTMILLLLCAPSVWATIICNCSPVTTSSHACCQTMQMAQVSENKHQNQAGTQSASHCKNTQLRKISQHWMSCCEASAQSELESAEFLPTVTLAVEENNLTATRYYRQIPEAPPFRNNHPREPQRALYLALSCWLI